MTRTRPAFVHALALLAGLAAALPALATDPCPEEDIDLPLAPFERFRGPYAVELAGAGFGLGEPALLDVTLDGAPVAAWLYWAGEVRSSELGIPGTTPDRCLTIEGGALTAPLELCGVEIGRRTKIFADEENCNANGGEVVLRAAFPLAALAVGSNRFELSRFNDPDPDALCFDSWGEPRRHFRRGYGAALVAVTEAGPDCDRAGLPCRGKLTEMTLRYTGASCDQISNPQSGKARCDGDAAGASPVDIRVTDKKGGKVHGEFFGVASGETITVAPEGRDFGADVRVLILDPVSGEKLAGVQFHTSCSQPLATGDVFGPITLQSFADKQGPREGESCDREVILLEGADLASGHPHAREPDCADDFEMAPACFRFETLACDAAARLLFAAGGVEPLVALPGERTFVEALTPVTAPPADLSSGGDLIEADLLNLPVPDGHYDGDRLATFDAPWTVQAGADELCFQIDALAQASGPFHNILGFAAALQLERDCPDAGEPPADACEGGVRRLVLSYTGDDCSVLTNPQNGKARCEGDVQGRDPVRIDVSGKKIAPPHEFDDVPIGGRIELRAERDKIGADTSFEIRDPLTGSVLAKVRIHTSCSQPLAAGDRFGPLRVEILESKGGP